MDLESGLQVSVSGLTLTVARKCDAPTWAPGFSWGPFHPEHMEVRKVWNLKRSPKVLRRNLPSRGQITRTSLVVQWLKLHSTNVGDMDSIPGQGTKIPHATPRGVKKEKKMDDNSCHLQVFSPLPCSSLQRW